MPSSDGAVHGSRARSVSSTALAHRERVPFREDRDHRLLVDVDAAQAVGLAARQREVLEAQAGVQVAAADRVGDRGMRSLLHGHLQVGLGGLQRGEGGRRDRGDRAGERSEAELPPLLRHDGADLAVGELEPGGERVRVLEQQGAGRRGHRPAAPADEQLRAQLALEAAHLLGDRGLAERERDGRVRERALAGDRPERQQPAWIEHSLSLSIHEDRSFE